MGGFSKEGRQQQPVHAVPLRPDSEPEKKSPPPTTLLC
jgi:hypothetical protein